MTVKRPNVGIKSQLRIIFDSPPNPNGCQFVECENAEGQSVNAGEWREREDGLWELIVNALPISSE